MGLLPGMHVEGGDENALDSGAASGVCEKLKSSRT